MSSHTGPSGIESFGMTASTGSGGMFAFVTANSEALPSPMCISPPMITDVAPTARFGK